MLPPPPQQNAFRTPALEKYLDRKNNWIYDTPNTVDREKALHEIFGVRDEHEFANFDKRPKRVMEQYFEGNKDSKKNARTNSSNDPNNERDPFGAARSEGDTFSRWGGREDADKSEIPGIIPALNPAYLFNWKLGPEWEGAESAGRVSILPPNLGEPTFGQKMANPATPAPQDAVAGQREMTKPWELKQSPLGRLNDTLSGSADGNRFGIPTVPAKKASIPPPDQSAGTGNDPFPFRASAGMAPPTSPDLFELNKINPGATIYTPTLPSPASAPVMQPKPAVLDIPRPRF
jgi:hypothetical protein